MKLNTLKKITAWSVVMVMTMGISLSSFAKDTDIVAPKYNPDWGLNLPQKIVTDTGLTDVDDAITLDVVKTAKSANDKNYVLAWQLEPLEILAQIAHPGKTNFGNFEGLARAAVEGLQQWVLGYYDKDGKPVAVKNGYLPDIDINYIKSLSPGDVIYSIVIKKDHPLAKGVKLQRETYWEKVNSNIFGPGESTTLEKDLHYGVTTSDSYTFAKTIGTSQGIKIGGQLGGEQKRAKGGLSAEYSYTMTNSVTNTVSHSRTITNDETSKIIVNDKNDTDHVGAYGLYRAVETYTQIFDGKASPWANQALVNNAVNVLALIKQNALGSGQHDLRIGSSYTYRYSDYATLKSN